MYNTDMGKMQVPIHMSPQRVLKSLKCKAEDFGQIALLCGQKHRVDFCLKYLKDIKKNFSFSGYTFFTGTYKGKKVTVGNSGMYAPDTAMMVDILCAAKIGQFLRIGSCGSLSLQIDIGDIIISESAIRGEGTTKYYVDDDFVPQADRVMNEKLRSLIDGAKIHCGSVWTMDAIFREIPEIVDPIIAQGAIAVDMVTSVVLTLASINNRKATAMLAVSDNVLTAKTGFQNPAFKQSEEKLIQTAYDYISVL